ncbi:Uncharacterised protein [uncultured archaeon]|nr:Uncharacterised protein [uncultured archaeon]
MNKRGQEKEIMGIIGAIIGIILLGAVLIFLSNLSCSNEKSQIASLTSERDTWRSYANSLNDSVNNCSNLIKEQRDICDSRINQSINDTSTKLEISLNYVTVNKIFFAVYHILIIFFYIPLSINLFKIVFKIKLNKKWEGLIGFWKRAWLILKIIFWVILSVIFISYITTFLTSKPF